MNNSKIERIEKSISLNNRPIFKKILENSEPLQSNVVDFIEKIENYKENIVDIIKASGKDVAMLAGAAMNSAIEVPVQLVKLKCLQDVLVEIKSKLENMPVKELYKVYTASSPIAIVITGVKTKIDDAINEFLSEQCKENIPKLMSVIDVAYNAAKEASAAIDRLAGEEDAAGKKNRVLNGALQDAPTKQQLAAITIYRQKYKAGDIISDSKARAKETKNKISQIKNDAKNEYTNLQKLSNVAKNKVKTEHMLLQRIAANKTTTGADEKKSGLGASSTTLISISVTHGKTTRELESLDAGSMTVDELKAKLHLLTNVPADMMKLVANGKTLTTGTLGENKLKEGAKLRLIGNTKAEVAAANLAPDGDRGKQLTDILPDEMQYDHANSANQSNTDIHHHRIPTENIIRKIAVTAGGAKSYMRKPHRRRTRHHKTQRRRTRHHKTQRRRTRHYKTHRNKKKPRRRTIRRKKRHKRKTR